MSSNSASRTLSDSCLQEGDRVRILHEFQDEGDDEFERIVVEAPTDSPRVLVKTLIPGFEHLPTERIEVRMLEKLPPKPGR